MPRTAKPPKYRHHRAKNLALVTIDGRDVYLGPYDSPESWAKYHQIVADKLAGRPLDLPPLRGQVASPRPEPSLTIAALVGAFRGHAETYYVKDGRPTKELTDMKYAARPLVKLFGPTPADKFGPLALKQVRIHMVEVEGLSRRVTNARVNRIKRIFKWAVSEELVPPSVYEGLRTVSGLRYGRTNARETEPIKPALRAWVEPILTLVSSPVAAMIEVQWLTGMRPCEVVAMRRADIETSGDIWIYEPAENKNRWRGHSRLVPLGPQAQAILESYRDRPPGMSLFSPKEAEAIRNAVRRKDRKTPMTPSQAKRRPKPSPGRAKREQYDVDAYRRAITYGIRKANRDRTAEDQIPDWCPLQLRHSRATEVRKRFGLEAAQVTLDHARADVTQVYAERNLEAAIEVARAMG